MRPETEVLLVAAMDGMITRLDNALDELDGLDSNAARNVETILLGMTMELNGIIDRLTEEAYEKVAPDA